MFVIPCANKWVTDVQICTAAHAGCMAPNISLPVQASRLMAHAPTPSLGLGLLVGGATVVTSTGRSQMTYLARVSRFCGCCFWPTYNVNEHRNIGENKEVCIVNYKAPIGNQVARG